MKKAAIIREAAIDAVPTAAVAARRAISLRLAGRFLDDLWVAPQAPASMVAPFLKDRR